MTILSSLSVLSYHEVMEFGRYALVACTVLLIVAVVVAIREVRRARRLAKARERFDSTFEETFDTTTGPLMIVIADRFAKRSVKVTRFGDKRYRDGHFATNPTNPTNPTSPTNPANPTNRKRAL